MSKTSPKSCEVIETRELRDRELALVTGGCDANLLNDAAYAFKHGDIFGGMQALAEYRHSCKA